jgi:endonuclease I
MMKITALLCLSLVLTTGAQNATSFEGCALNSYYASILADFGTAPTTWGQENVRSLIQNTHRNILPNTATIAGGDDILTALIDLDRGTSNDTVRLLYRNINFPSLPAGDRNSWSREDLWPIERGATRESPALTDVHSKKPADSSVLLKKDRLFFGICGTVENEGACSRPATTETADDTEQDSKIFAPPASFRGDVARSLFYTALRYEEQLGLRLTDCPPFRDGEFGYLSMLLKWHEEDRVSPEEQARNNRACERWQGNRNPFVDYPELVTQYFGQPDTIVDGTRTYSQCTTPTNAPTADPNECSDLKPGDIPVFVLNSDDPDQVVFYPLADIPASIGELYVTDDAWTGTGFQGIEGTITVSSKLPHGGSSCFYSHVF